MRSVLDSIVTPREWDLVPFGRLVERSRRAGRPDLPPLSVFLDQGVVPRSSRPDNYNRLGSNLAKYLVVRPGDVVFNKLRTWQGGLGVSRYTGIVSPAYFVCRPSARVNSRYLHFLLRSSPYLAELTRVSKFMPPSQFDILWDDLRALPILMPKVEVQAAIADYLDIETGRIDALICKKRRMIELLEERERALLDQWYDYLSSDYGLVAVRRWSTRIEQGWSPVCDSEPAQSDEWGVLKTSAVSTGVFLAMNNKRLPDETEPDMRWQVGDGDLLVTRGSGSRSMVGRACVARVGNRHLTLSDLVYRIVLIRADPNYVAAAMSSSPAREQIEGSIRTDVGQTLKVRRNDLAEIRIPAVADEQQPLEAACLTSNVSSLQSSRLAIENQLRLLAERRRALISAAVTGELAVQGRVE